MLTVHTLHSGISPLLRSSDSTPPSKDLPSLFYSISDDKTSSNRSFIDRIKTLRSNPSQNLSHFFLQLMLRPNWPSPASLRPPDHLSSPYLPTTSSELKSYKGSYMVWDLTSHKSPRAIEVPIEASSAFPHIRWSHPWLRWPTTSPPTTAMSNPSAKRGFCGERVSWVK